MPLVYIVDDEVNIRQLAAFGLQDAGFETQEFASGSEVLYAMQQRMPDALVLDWMMPPPDGLSVCHSIRENPAQRHLTRGVFTIDLARHQLTKSGTPVALSLREFDLLYELMKKPGRVLTREMLLERVWKTEFFGDTRTVDVHIRYLRQKIEDEPDHPQYILTVRGVGYCFAEDNR